MSNKGHIYSHEDSDCINCGAPWSDSITYCPASLKRGERASETPKGLEPTKKIKLNTPCFDKGLKVCLCGTDLNRRWETKGWCESQLRMVHKPLTEKEIILMDYRERLVRKIRYYCENAPGLEHDIIDIIYRA